MGASDETHKKETVERIEPKKWRNAKSERDKHENTLHMQLICHAMRKGQDRAKKKERKNSQKKRKKEQRREEERS